MQKLFQNLKSIAILTAKFRKFCNAYYKISKVLEYLLQNLKVLKNFKSITILSNSIGTTPEYNIIQYNAIQHIIIYHNTMYNSLSQNDIK